MQIQQEKLRSSRVSFALFTVKKFEIEDDLFQARLELDSSKAETRNSQQQLQDAEKRIAHLKKQLEDLKMNSRKFSRELTYSNIDTLQDLKNHEMEVLQIKSELKDPDSAASVWHEVL